MRFARLMVFTVFVDFKITSFPCGLTSYSNRNNVDIAKYPTLLGEAILQVIFVDFLLEIPHINRGSFSIQFYLFLRFTLLAYFTCVRKIIHAKLNSLTLHENKVSRFKMIL